MLSIFFCVFLQQANARKEELSINKEEDFSIKIHYFLKEVKKGNISIENKKELYYIVNTLNSRTKKQKERFLLYYGLMSNDKPLTLLEIGKLNDCSPNAVRSSVVRIKSKIAVINGVQRKKLLDMIESEEKIYNDDIV